MSADKIDEIRTGFARLRKAVQRARVVADTLAERPVEEQRASAEAMLLERLAQANREHQARGECADRSGASRPRLPRRHTEARLRLARRKLMLERLWQRSGD